MTSFFVHGTRNGAAGFQTNMHLPVRQNPNLSTISYKPGSINSVVSCGHFRVNLGHRSPALTAFRRYFGNPYSQVTE
jgi:hypothetical protein